MNKQYDLIAIGTGSGASDVVYGCRDAGWKVAIVDNLPMGGTCALRGCDPKKILVGAAEAIDHVHRMRGKGLVAEGLNISWSELMKFKRTFTDPVPPKREKEFAEEGIDAYHGTAKFSGPKTLLVGNEILEAKHILIAAGATPVHLGIVGEEHVITSTEFLDLEQLPKRIILIGGGFIAAEFSHIAARAGAKVIILQDAERMLTPFEPELVAWLMDKFKEVGIDVQTGTRVTSVVKQGSEFTVHASSKNGEELFQADLVVHAAGRVPNLASLDLSKAGIETEKGRIKLNDFLQSVSNPAVYASGDAAMKGPALTPVAAYDAETVLNNLLKGNSKKSNYLGIPSVAFTIPPISSVGMSEKQATEKSLKFKVKIKNASDWYNARRTGEKIYGFKVIVEDGTDLILGAHLVGPYADEVINIFALAIRNGLTAEAVRETIFTYPGGSSDVGYML